jgi:transposase
MHNFLTDEEKSSLKARVKQEKDLKIGTRIKVIILADQGRTYEDIAQFHLLDRGTVSSYVQEYATNQNLTHKSSGWRSKLSPEQTAELDKHLTEHTYATTAEICEHIREKYGLTYHPGSLAKWLKNHDFSYKKPDPVPAKADAARQAAFIEEYEKFKASKPADEVVVWIDGVHPTMETKISYGWIKKGTKKPIETTASRTRVNELGALKLDTMTLIICPYETIDSKSVEMFFAEIRREVGEDKKIHVFSDNGGYFKTEAVKAAAKELNLEQHFIPPYSPNLNPIERVWKVQNKYARNNVYFKSPTEFREALTHFAKTTWNEISGTLSSWVNDNFKVMSEGSPV